MVPRDEVDSPGVKLTFLLILMYENGVRQKRRESKENAIKTDGLQVTRQLLQGFRAWENSIPDP